MPDKYTPVPEYILNEDEKKKIVECWNGGARNLIDIIKYAIGPGFDGRSAQGKAVKKHLAERNMANTVTHVYLKKAEREILEKVRVENLADGQKESIANNWRDMAIPDLVELLYPNQEITQTDDRYKDVRDFVKKLSGAGNEGDRILADYKPPKTEAQILNKIRQCATVDIKEDGQTPKFMEGVARLLKFISSFKFVYEMNNLKHQSERDLFESSFIKYTYTKPDLSEEEVDAYIDVCSEIIAYERMKQEEVMLADEARAQMGEDQKNIKMGIVEAMGKLRTTMDQNKKRRDKTLEGLNGLRADRLDKIETGSATIANLIQAFRNADKRNKILTDMESKRDGLNAEIQRLSGMDALFVEVFGVGQKEISP